MLLNVYACLNFSILLSMVYITKAIRSATTIVEPMGVPERMETIIPTVAQITEIRAEAIVTDRKLL